MYNQQPPVIVRNSFPIVPILGILFIGLKLAGIINWSWLWVLSPFWIPVALVTIILAVGFIFYMLTNIGKK